MRAMRPIDWSIGLLGVALTLFHWWNVAAVPFHPDETSLIFQSRDLEHLLSDPFSLAWRSDRAPDPELTYRVLNAPLTKYILALGRLGAGYTADEVAVDWDWSKSWEENQEAGAVPSARLLLGTRMAVSILFPLTLFSVYRLGKAVGGKGAGVGAMAFLGAHGLVLLHARRAMAEGPLLLAMALACLSYLDASKRPWLAGLATALAFSAKQSAGALLPVGLVASAGIWDEGPLHRGKAMLRAIQFLACFAALTLLLYPLLWAEPLGAITAMWRARQELLSAQAETLATFLPGQVLGSLGMRLAALVYHLFLGPLQFAEVGNYLAYTNASVLAYLRMPGHTLLVGYTGGGLLMGLALFGWTLGGVEAVRRRREDWGGPHGVLVTAALAVGVALLAAVSLPYQRYYTPLVPLVCVWGGYGLQQLFRPFKRKPARSPATSD